MSGHPALYDVLVAAHVVAAVVGFATVALSGAYGVVARQPNESEEVSRFFSGRLRAEWLVLVVPLLGAAALAVRPGHPSAGWGATWTLAGWLIWLAAGALLVGLVRPAEAVIRSGGEAGRRVRAATRLAWAAAASDLLFVVAAFLMVTQPG